MTLLDMSREDLENLQNRAILYSKNFIISIMFSVLNQTGRKCLLGHKTDTFLNESVASEPTNSYSDINFKEQNNRTAPGNFVVIKGFVKKYSLPNTITILQHRTKYLTDTADPTWHRGLLYELYKLLVDFPIVSLKTTSIDGLHSFPPDPGGADLT
jgi:hypothetical protein